MLPSRFVPIVTAGIGNIKKVALQNALQFLGIGHLQFLDVTSVIPSGAGEGMLDELRQLPIGQILPAILSIHYVSLPPSEPRSYGASIFILPTYRDLSLEGKFYLAVEDRVDAPLDARLVSDVDEIKAAVVGHEDSYRESVQLGMMTKLYRGGQVERHLAAFAGVTPAKMVISLFDSKSGYRQWLVDDMVSQGWLCLLSGIVFIDLIYPH
jgi:hypothetical protein